MVGGHSHLHRFFPAIFPQYDEIILGETFEGDLTISTFLDFYKRRKIPISIYLNNKKIEMNTDRYKFKLNTDSLGKQKIEAIIHCTHPDTHKTGKDTTYLEYTVTP
ncbi:MAG: hypothetical protein ACI94Y_002798 [Maribacter sp.]|jgi:hypothetical protein